MAERKSILVVEDSRRDQQLMVDLLEHEGYEVTVADDGEEALGAVAQQRPNLVLLDIMLPGIDGVEVCRRLRESHNVPVLMVTARDDEIDVVVGLEVGADDYITKPYSPRELTARVKALLRRSVLTEKAEQRNKHLSFPGLEIDLPRRTVDADGSPVHLTPKEFDLLFLLASEPQRVFKREEIIEEVWGYTPRTGDLRTVDTHVKRIRKKVEEGRDVPWTLSTVWGIGYKFEPGQ